MEKAYVSLDDIADFLKKRNTKLNTLIGETKETEPYFRQKELLYIMRELPKIVQPSLVFAEVEENTINGDN